MAITTIDEVKFTGGLTDEYADEEILSEIDLVESELYQKYYLPKRSSFSVDADYTVFYIYPDAVHEVIRVKVAVETSIDPSGYSLVESGSTTWEHIPPYNYLNLQAPFISTYDGNTVRIDSIPKIFNLIAKNTVALNLIETTTIIDGALVTTPLAQKLKDRIKRYTDIIKPKGFTKSSTNIDYDLYNYVSYTQTDLR